MGGNAFNSVINNHLWSGATAPTDGYVLSWDASALSGAGDYSWIAQSSGSYGDSDVESYLNGGWDFHLIPDANAQYDLGNAEYKVRHLFLSDNSIKMGDNEISIGLVDDKLTVEGHRVSESSYEFNTIPAPIDITKRHHFLSGQVNYTLPNGTYIGQELHFWRSAVGTGYSDITIDNAKWTAPGDATTARSNFVWRTNGSDEADNRTFMAVWDGEGWCLSGGTEAV
tara:strand:- start:42 stop:719 length:678 start_codon:yes stop_codon:yes gene_type:complete